MSIAGIFILFAYLLKYTKKNTLVRALALPESLAVIHPIVLLNFLTVKRNDTETERAPLPTPGYLALALISDHQPRGPVDQAVYPALVSNYACAVCFDSCLDHSLVYLPLRV
jgi:hypothetical protein